MKRVLLLVALALVSAACGRVTDPPAAEVGDRRISFDRIDAELEKFRDSDRFKTLADQGDVGAIERDFSQSVLAQLIRRAVLAPAAREFGLDIGDAQVQEQIEIIKTDFPSESAFNEALKEQGLDIEALEDLVMDRLLEEGVRQSVTEDVGPTEEELRAEYEANLETYRQVEVSHILVTDREKAEELSEELQATPDKRLREEFEKRARRLSQDRQSAPLGGNLGFSQPDRYVEPFADAVRTLDIGQVSDPVETEFGFHVIYVTARRTLEFEEVREDLRTQLGGPAKDEAFAEWLREAYEDVWVNPRFGEVDPVTGAISDPGAEQVPGAEAPVLEAPGDAQPSPLPGQ